MVWVVEVVEIVVEVAAVMVVRFSCIVRVSFLPSAVTHVGLRHRYTKPGGRHGLSPLTLSSFSLTCLLPSHQTQ